MINIDLDDIDDEMIYEAFEVGGNEAEALHGTLRRLPAASGAVPMYALRIFVMPVNESRIDAII